MFQYLGENTSYSDKGEYGLLKTSVMGFRFSIPETLSLHTQISRTKNEKTRLYIMVRDSDSGPLNERFRLDIPLGEEGPFFNTSFNHLLKAHSACLEDLRQGKIIEESRLIATLTDRDPLVVLAERG